MRLPLAVFRPWPQAAGPGIAVGVRLSATDWVEGGWDIEQTVAISKRLEALGCAFLDISSGGVSYQQKIPLGPGYQVQFAERIKREVGIPVVTVGLITEPAQAEAHRRAGPGRHRRAGPRLPARAALALARRRRTGRHREAPPQLLRSLPPGHRPIFGDVKVGQR